MQEHLSAESIELYCRRAMGPAELLLADDHLARCDDCYARAAETIRPEALLSALAAVPSEIVVDDSDHLTYEQLAAYVDAEVDQVGREIADVHLEVCQQCAEELRGLRELKEEPPLADTHAPAARKSKPRRDALPRRWVLGWRPLSLAAAALVLIVAGTLLWVVWRQISQSRREVAGSLNPGSGSQSPVPSVVAPVPEGTGQTSAPAANTQSAVAPQPMAASAASRIVVALNDGGGRVTLDEQGIISGLGDLSPSEREAVREVLVGQPLPLSVELQGLTGKSGVLMGGGEGAPFALTDPVGKVLRTDRPRFRWQPLGGASAYLVNVYDQNYNKVAASPRLTSTDWEVPTPLKRGVVYLWQVTAIKDGQEIRSPVRPAPDARFKVMEMSKAEELDRVRKLHPNSHLLLGTLYARTGLLGEAEREFRLLFAANNESPVARKLLREVQALRAER